MVQEALARLMKDRTTVVIAHRLSTIRNADEIVVLNRGGLWNGAHSRLMATGGMYCHLINNNYESEMLNRKSLNEFFEASFKNTGTSKP